MLAAINLCGILSCLRPKLTRDVFVFGLTSTELMEKCMKVGPSLTFQKAKAIAKFEDGESQHKKTSYITPIHKLNQ